jgi:hypothetical protein
MDRRKSGNPNFIPKWKHTPTKAIRVPKAFEDQLLSLAKNLDQGKITEIPPKSDPYNLEDMTAVKLKILKSLKIGSQSSTYKKVEKALNKFIEEVF